MSSSSKATKPDVVTYGDHELITPDTNKLRKMLRAGAADEEDPVARAETALAQIASEFSTLDERRMRAPRRRAPQGQGSRPDQGDPGRSCFWPPMT